MESTVLGVVLDCSVLIGAERAKLETPEVITTIWSSIGDLPIVISALTMAELGHGIYRAQNSERRQQRRRFLDGLKSQIPVHPVTDRRTHWRRASCELPDA